MNKPSQINRPIDNKRFRKWAKFSSYRSPATRQVIEEWLTQFTSGHRDLGARLLDAIMYFELSSIISNFQSILNSMTGWHTDPQKRTGRWFFVAMSGSAGESGDLMLSEFRRANGLTHKMYDRNFITRSELVRQGLTNEDTIVLVDDFTGTGDQICEVWNDPEVAFSELTAGAGKVYLIVIAATLIAKNRISQETPLLLITSHILTEKDNLFSKKCPHFSDAEKVIILKYATRADKKNPKGYGECGLLVVFSHSCPNNSIPILHAQNSKWEGLFPRQS